MPERSLIREKAKEAERKKAAFGPDIDLSLYTSDGEDLSRVSGLGELPPDVKEKALAVGTDADEAVRAGSFFQMNNTVLFSSSREAGLEVMSITEALERYDWLSDYWWRALKVDTDKYTALAELRLHHGYFIRALRGAKVLMPVQACLYLGREMFSQNVHNIIMAEEGSELHIITGCTTGRDIKSGMHVGISEFYVKENAHISFSMIHNWAEDVVVRPRSGAIIEDGGVFLSNYICMKPVRTLQMYPVAYCTGKNAVARFNSVLLAYEGSDMDVGSRVVLSAPGCRAEVIARTITVGGNIISRGHLVGEAPDIKAHLECRGLILRGKGSIYAIPELEGKLPNIDMSHEAAVGKIAEEEIQYFMARGLTAEEATAAIVRGFLDIDIKGLPEQLAEEIKRSIAMSEEAERLF
ncbi:MAG TPA: SufD family Fe-S cluster assembly protein [Thermodesulfovibrionales bacterium]|nr:SufD family Fe-S cluster assembly protein [Thermodesulfovibrionales bacterium]